MKLLTRKRGIVDLMLSRAQKRHRADDYEHLVVELKAPKVKLTSKETTQIMDYALSVSRDPRYHRMNGVGWHFWLVSDEYDDYVQSMLEGGPDRERRLIHQTDKVSVGVKTWGEILDENNARLQFVKKALSTMPTTARRSRFLKSGTANFWMESSFRMIRTSLPKHPLRLRLLVSS